MKFLFIFAGPAAKYLAHICAAGAPVPLTCVGGLPALICAAERLVPICADGAVPAPTWNDAVPAPIWDDAAPAPTWADAALAPLWEGAVLAPTWDDAVPAPIWEGAVSALPVLLPIGAFVFLRPPPRPRLTTILIPPPRPVSILKQHLAASNIFTFPCRSTNCPSLVFFLTS
jgi:hypothetical protein